MRRALAFLMMFVAVFSAAPALAAPSPGLDLAAWVGKNTDLPVSQIAIAGRENVYGLEPLGSRTSTGEVLALIRTEAVAPEWRAAHQFQSWDAHLLFDCNGERVRVLRSASYPEPGRQGPARSNDVGGSWFSPEADTPAATLLSAACDPNFTWPLRESSTPKMEASVVQAAVAGPVAPAARLDPRAPVQPAVQVAQAVSAPASDAPSSEQVRTVAAAVTHESPPLAEKRRTALVSVAVHAEAPRAEPRPAETAWPQTTWPQTTWRAEPRLSRFIQKASYPSGPTVGETSIDPVTVDRTRHAGTLATTTAVMRTSLRWAGAGRGWLVRRVEVVFRRRPAPPLVVPGSIRQAQAY